jgi:hypothetical protein
VAGSPLIGLFCLAARLAALGCRVTAFLKELLIGRAEGKFLPTVTACNLHVSGHKTPREGIVQPKPCFFCKDSFGQDKKSCSCGLSVAPNYWVRWARYSSLQKHFRGAEAIGSR